MVKAYKNNWILFGVITFLGVITFTGFMFQSWKQHSHEFFELQKSKVELFSNSTTAFFNYQASYLDSLGQYILYADSHSVDVARTFILDQALESNPAIKAIVVRDIDGNPLAASSSYDFTAHDKVDETEPHDEVPDISPHLLRIGRTHLSTVHSTDTDNMALPITRKVKEGNGKVHAIITAGVKLNNLPLFHDRYQSFHTFEVLRWDKYLQYRTNSVFQDYEESVPESYFEQIVSSDKTGMRIDESDVYALHTEKKGETYRTVVAYEPTLESWFISSVPNSYVLTTFIYKHLLMISAFVVSLIFFFFITRYVNRIERKRVVALKYQSEHDILTGLPNRVFLRDNLITWLKTWDRAALIYIDIDEFRQINDNHGYHVGDRLLVEIANRIKSVAMEALIAREYANSFIMIIPDADDTKAQIILSKVRNRLAKSYEVEGNRILISASFGVVRYPEHGDSLNDLMTSADIAMTHAKQERNSVSFLSSAMVESHQTKVDMAQRLRHAIKDDKIFMVYQPQISSSGEVHGLESLARWVDTELGFVPPDKFIELAETSGQMVELGRLIIRKTLTDFALIRSKSSMPLRVSINVSAKQFLDQDFILFLVTEIDSRGLSTTDVTVEVTESLFIEDLKRLQPTFMQLSFFGINLSVDDFGTGYSSLSLLNQVRLNELKIDRAFLASMTQNRRAFELLKTILSMSKALHVLTVAEGVETEEQKNILSEYDCDVYQGYLFSKPISVEDTIKFLEDYPQKK